MKKEQLIDYLYGELQASDRLKFEADQEGVDQASNLGEVRAFLQSDEDEEPHRAPIYIKPRRKIIISKWWAMAASLVLLLSAGRIFDLRLEKSDRAITLSYGPTDDVQSDQGPSYDELLASVATLRRDLSDRMDGLQRVATNTVNKPSTPTDQQASITALKRLLEKENALFAEELTQQLQSNQQAYTLEVVNTLLDYWDGQRKQDLEVVNSNLQNLAQTIQLNSDEFAQFTNQSVQNY